MSAIFVHWVFADETSSRKKILRNKLQLRALLVAAALVTLCGLFYASAHSTMNQVGMDMGGGNDTMPMMMMMMV